MSMEPKVRTWLWVVLATVIVLGGGITYWYVYGSKGTFSPTISPTTGRSAVTSASPGATATSSKTSTPGQTATPTATPTSTTPPTGWKIDNNQVYEGRGTNAGGSYQVYIKEDWQVVEGDIAPSRAIYYGNSDCEWVNQDKCFASVGVSKTSYNDSSNYSFQAPSKDYYLTLHFYSSISDQDKKIIVDSFKAL